MSALPFADSLYAFVHALPKFFLFGAPIVLALLGIAAFVDTRVPHDSSGDRHA